MRIKANLTRWSSDLGQIQRQPLHRSHQRVRLNLCTLLMQRLVPPQKLAITSLSFYRRRGRLFARIYELEQVKSQNPSYSKCTSHSLILRCSIICSYISSGKTLWGPAVACCQRIPCGSDYWTLPSTLAWSAGRHSVLAVSLGTILCYPPNFLKTAYNFPPTTGHKGLDGKGQTIVIVDAFGSPTIQSDLNAYDAAFGLPATRVTILCGPAWTGAATDNCPVKTIADLTTAPNAILCGATGWAEETTLDVNDGHSLAPGAHIVLVVGNDCFDTSLYGAEIAVSTKPNTRVASCPRASASPTDLVTCTALDPTNTYCVSRDPTLLNLPNLVFQTAQVNHWTVIASSGRRWREHRRAGHRDPSGSLLHSQRLVHSSSRQAARRALPTAVHTVVHLGQAAFSLAARKTCNTGLVVVNGGENGCGTAVRPGEPTSCYPVGYGGESTWNEVPDFRSYWW